MHYRFSYDNPNRHFIQVDLTIDNLSEESLVLHLPSWRPGRYQITNFAKKILRLNVKDETGEILQFHKTSKDSWLVQLDGRQKIIVSYQYYAFTMDAGNSWLDEDQLYINFINCAIFVEDRLSEICTIDLDVPNNYQFATGLPSTGKKQFTAESYYQLVDSPLIASSSLRRIKYDVEGHEFNVWIQGELPRSDAEIIEDFERFTQKQIEAMGEFPCKDYHFLFQCLPYQHYHGVEHFNSTTITVGPSEELAKRAGYKKLLGVSCHELFHTWNVIRLRPKEMMPYDFKTENYHQTGFITEGVTTYYGDLYLVRSGVFSIEEYLEELNRMLKRHFENDGRNNMSVADSSYDLWLDGYEVGIPGRKVSIYNEGALAALILDLMIRLKWNHERSLDDVMRTLWQSHGRNSSGYIFEDYKRAAEEIFEEPLDSYFKDYITGTTPFERALKPLFESFGLSFKSLDSEKSEERNFGFRLSKNKVIKIESGSPAEEVLSINDEILKVNGNEWTEQTLFEGITSLEIQRFSKNKSIELVEDQKSHFSIFQVSAILPHSEMLLKWLSK